MDAIELLKRDHQEVTKLFQRFATDRGGRERRAIVEKICDELDVHTRIEEEIFYPAVRQADRELARKVDEALREHARVKEQVSALRGEGEEAADLQARVTALEQDVEHHVTEEEGEMFPRVAQVIDERRRAELGRRLEERKGELTDQAGRGARTEATARARSTARGRSAGRARRAKATGRREKTRERGSRARSGRAKQRSAKARGRKSARRRARTGRSR